MYHDTRVNLMITFGWSGKRFWILASTLFFIRVFFNRALKFPLYRNHPNKGYSRSTGQAESISRILHGNHHLQYEVHRIVSLGTQCSQSENLGVYFFKISLDYAPKLFLKGSRSIQRGVDRFWDRKRFFRCEWFFWLWFIGPSSKTWATSESCNCRRWSWRFDCRLLYAQESKLSQFLRENVSRAFVADLNGKEINSLRTL